MAMGTAVVAVGVVTALGQAATAQPDGESGRSTMSAAMQRDLGLSPSEAKARIADESRAAKAQKDLRGELGASYGGAWFDASSGKLVVGVTSDGNAAKARTAGAETRQVAHSEKQLSAYMNRLDKARAKAPDAVPGWYVDVKANKVVVRSSAAAVGDTKAFVKKAGVPARRSRSRSRPRRPARSRSSEATPTTSTTARGAPSASRSTVDSSRRVTAATRGDTTTQPSGTFAGLKLPRQRLLLRTHE